MAVCRYGISLFVFNLISHSLAALTRETSLVKYQALYLHALMYSNVLSSIVNTFVLGPSVYGCHSTCVDLGWVAKRWKTCFDLRANLISTKVSASQRRRKQALAKLETESQVDTSFQLVSQNTRKTIKDPKRKRAIGNQRVKTGEEQPIRLTYERNITYLL